MLIPTNARRLGVGWGGMGVERISPTGSGELMLEEVAEASS